MNDYDKFQLCMNAAKEIVAAHRSEAPDGCDPQNSWFALIGTGVSAAVSVGTTAYQSSQQKKAAEKASKGGGGNQLEEVEFPDMPPYIPVDFRQLQDSAVKADYESYRRSDRDFARRHGGVIKAEQAFETDLANQWAGKDRLSPQLQAELMTSGLEKGITNLGDAGPVLTSGSAGEAALAKNLGLGVLQFQNMRDQKREQALQLGEAVFPRREFGLGGRDAAGVGVSNISALNAWNQAKHAEDVEEVQFNAQLRANNMTTAANTRNAEASAKGQESAANAQMWGSLASSVLSSGAQAYGSYAASKPTATVTPRTVAPTRTTVSGATTRV